MKNLKIKNMEKLRIKIIVGFREEQHITINANEAHKAYYLFLNPEERGIFDNGVALIGKNIQGIEPDYNSTMGWNITHKLDSNDWNEIRGKGIDEKLRNVLSMAKDAVRLTGNKKLDIPLSELGKEMLPEGN